MRKKVLQVLFNISCYSRLHPFPGWYFLLSKMQRETLELFSGIYLQGEPLPGAVGGLEWVAGAAVGMGLLRGDRQAAGPETFLCRALGETDLSSIGTCLLPCTPGKSSGAGAACCGAATGAGLPLLKNNLLI